MTTIKRIWVLIAALLVTTHVPDVRGQVTDTHVREAIRRGTTYLKKQQKANGSWSEYPGQVGGVTSLCTLALLNAGLKASSPEIQKALSFLRSLGPPEMVYATSLQTMVFCAAEPEKDRLMIARNVAWLEDIQIKDGKWSGAWRYSDRRGNGDNSNTQFALLALHEAQRIGVAVEPGTWRRALDHWLRAQRETGGWSYVFDQPPLGSMTCAGIASVIIAGGKMGQADASVDETGNVACCGAQSDNSAIQNGLQWLGNSFSVTRNPTANARLEENWLYYYLYGMERVGRLSGRRFIGGHDWFREGAEFLVRQQTR